MVSGRNPIVTGCIGWLAHPPVCPIVRVVCGRSVVTGSISVSTFYQRYSNVTALSVY